MSKFDLLWNESQAAAAAEEGWQLVLVVNEGRPVTSAYFEVFDKGPRFPSRAAAMKFVVDRAQNRSKLHIAALSACSATRLNTAASPHRKTTRRKTS